LTQHNKTKQKSALETANSETLHHKNALLKSKFLSPARLYLRSSSAARVYPSAANLGEEGWQAAKSAPPVFI
jgi:hypothetical protein